MSTNANLKKETQIILSSLIISSAKGLTIRNLRKDYREETGTDVPFKKLGFATFEQFLLSIPETCRINGSGDYAIVIPVVSEKVKHINEMIMKQKLPKSKSRHRNYKRSRGIYNGKTNFSENVAQPKVASSINKEKIEYMCEADKSSNTSLLYNIPYDSDVCDEFDDKLNMFNDEEDFLYKSDDETIPDNCNDSKVEEKIDLSTINFSTAATKQEIVRSKVNSAVKEKLRILISEYPDGIWCSKLMKFYEQRWNEELDPADFGFSSVVNLCDDVSDIFYCVRPNRTDWKIFDKRLPPPGEYLDAQFSDFLRSLPPAPAKKSSKPALPDNFLRATLNYIYPKNVFKPGDNIERQWLFNNEKEGDFIELIVSEVFDPSKFWIQLKHKDTSLALSNLMDDLQVFYMHNAKNLQLCEFSVRVGLYCAALFLNDFHRAIVIKIFDDETIKVFYIDYGTVGEVLLRKTCFLHQDFSYLPQQAIRARLANIIPREPNTMWPRPASQLMLELVRERDLIGYVTAIDHKLQILDLVITDTTKPDEDIHINDALIDRGYAELGNEALLCDTSTAIVPNVHLYPSFEEIENGVCPGIVDVIRMLKLGLTYEIIFRDYFKIPTPQTQPVSLVQLDISRNTPSYENYTVSRGASTDLFMVNTPEHSGNESLHMLNLTESDMDVNQSNRGSNFSSPTLITDNINYLENELSQKLKFRQDLLQSNPLDCKDNPTSPQDGSNIQQNITDTNSTATNDSTNSNSSSSCSEVNANDDAAIETENRQFKNILPPPPGFPNVKPIRNEFVNPVYSNLYGPSFHPTYYPNNVNYNYLSSAFPFFPARPQFPPNHYGVNTSKNVPLPFSYAYPLGMDNYCIPNIHSYNELRNESLLNFNLMRNCNSIEQAKKCTITQENILTENMKRKQKNEAQDEYKCSLHSEKNDNSEPQNKHVHNKGTYKFYSKFKPHYNNKTVLHK